MKNILFKIAFLLCLLPVMAACGGDDGDDNGTQPTIRLLTQSIANGSTVDAATTTVLTLAFNQKVSITTSADITLNGQRVTATTSTVSTTMVDIPLSLETGTDYTVKVSKGALVLSTDSRVEGPEVIVTFATKGVPQPVTPTLAATPVAATESSAVKLYNFLVKNYQKKTISGMMANVNWNNTESEKVFKAVGRYPAINGYDYIHLPFSGPTSWINYADITPVKTWHDGKGIVTIGWHWNVPSTEGSTAYGFYKGTDSSQGQTTFRIANAVTEGTWENRRIKADMAAVASHLKLLRDAGIPVLWRPLHEASGGWFWWGAGTAQQFKTLWVMMFDYFKQEGLTNLLWVWTDDKTDWYPGDEYVDVVGYDLYGETAATCADKYNEAQAAFPHKMIALTECGYSSYTSSLMATPTSQWNMGARWSWFMPWYDAATHAPASWWQTAATNSTVIWRDNLSDLPIY